MLWVLQKNYAGIEFGKGDEPDRPTVDMLSIAEIFPEEMACRETFCFVVLGYMQLIARKMKSMVWNKTSERLNLNKF